MQLKHCDVHKNARLLRRRHRFERALKNSLNYFRQANSLVRKDMDELCMLGREQS
jgi:hypothetical protein